ncbi:MAG: DNA helicase RecQ [Gammaproteobacteria bacterium]|nr:DNA helicase RecQ [Gammaproteobacteria bacterium]MBU1629191.1 DNA helicase RecQ [Gammaproteobacteria bacterium]MBU2546219.1 DNA helicase RecQ [Gammaproteobacteria bacterium]
MIPLKTNESLPSVLQRIYGYFEFRPGQREIIEGLLAGQDYFVLMPTGGGKSLCYQLPAIVSEGVVIVVSPLISLMRDQVDALQANGISAAFYNSSLGEKESRRVLAKLHDNELDLLYIAPERLVKPAFLERLKSINIALFAIDEAHCISQWGHEFRPVYTELSCLKKRFPEIPMIALTATADKQTRKDIVEQLVLRQPKLHVASFDRPNIRYRVVEKFKPFSQLVQFLKTHPDEAGIVYCISRRKVEEVSERLQAVGFSVMPYHAGLSTKLRTQAHQAFQNDNVQIIVATIAFGMGIDKPNIRFVVHYDMPKHIENYYQETGRAGRDGLPAEALLLFGLQDIAQLKSFITQMENEFQRRIETHKLNAMFGFAEAKTCRRKVLLNYFGETLEEDCDNCDVCLDPPEQYDATEEAQKALSCVYRLHQRFGLSYVIEVLRGAKNQRVLNMHHDQLSTYGIGTDKSEAAWYSLFRQLIHHGFIEQDIANYSTLKLTEKARPLLRGEMKLFLAKHRDKAVVAPKKKTKKKAFSDLQYDRDLFEKLRALRLQMAREKGIAPFIIFSDASLIEMSKEVPMNEHDFLQITGVGEKKLTLYGSAFLEVIQTHVG